MIADHPTGRGCRLDPNQSPGNLRIIPGPLHDAGRSGLPNADARRVIRKPVHEALAAPYWRGSLSAWIRGFPEGAIHCGLTARCQTSRQRRRTGGRKFAGGSLAAGVC